MPNFTYQTIKKTPQITRNGFCTKTIKQIFHKIFNFIEKQQVQGRKQALWSPFSHVLLFNREQYNLATIFFNCSVGFEEIVQNEPDWLVVNGQIREMPQCTVLPHNLHHGKFRNNFAGESIPLSNLYFNLGLLSNQVCIFQRLCHFHSANELFLRIWQ